MWVLGQGVLARPRAWSQPEGHEINPCDTHLPSLGAPTEAADQPSCTHLESLG